jgi:hypothetical protein
MGRGFEQIHELYDRGLSRHRRPDEPQLGAPDVGLMPAAHDRGFWG